MLRLTYPKRPHFFLPWMPQFSSMYTAHIPTSSDKKKITDLKCPHLKNTYVFLNDLALLFTADPAPPGVNGAEGRGGV